MSKKSICLNMIVKDESHIIRATLENLCHYIDFAYWVICDTGSTDNTCNIIRDFFAEKKIDGQIFRHEWRDFGYNRTLALNAAYDKSDYLVIFDADDSITGNFVIPDVLDCDKYNLLFGNETFKYSRPLLINNRKRWKFNGVLHEYLTNIDHISQVTTINGDYYIISGRLGNRSKNPDKYYDDAIILENAIKNISAEDKHLVPRYLFYCAQSFRDSNHNNRALEYYKQVLETQTWCQEQYVAALNIGNIYKTLNNMEEALHYWYKAIQYDKERLESIKNIMEYFYNRGNHFAVNCLYSKVKDYTICDKSTKLFLDTSQDDMIDYYNSISACYVAEWMSGYYSCKTLLLGDKHIVTTLSNLRCYIFNIWLDPDKNQLLQKLLDLFAEHYDSVNRQLVKDTWNLISDYFQDYLCNEETFRYLDCKYNGKDNENNNLANNSNSVKSKKILIYTGFSNVLWNDTYIESNSIGGSEKAVAYLARYLPKYYEIFISGDVRDEQRDNITYINRSHLQALLDREQFHTIIVSRYVSFFLLFSRFKCFQLFVMAHDVNLVNNFNNVDVANILQDWSHKIDGVIALTNWHKSNLEISYPFLRDKISIINNGVLIARPAQNRDLDKIRNKFVWTSCSIRGLQRLLDLWEEILAVMPDATLDISSYEDFPKYIQDNAMLAIINKHDSIRHHGKLNTTDLYAMISVAEYWLYTTDFNETSCITGLEMLMSGVICLYYPVAGLVDTIGLYGIQVQRGDEIQTISNLTREQKTRLIIEGKEYALSCSYENRAIEWSNRLGLRKRLAIFNSFPFHYEMFGFILNYAKNNDYVVDIYLNFMNNLGWIDFYKDRFKDTARFIDYKQYANNRNLNNYAYIFVTTDDDPLFKTEWINDTVICINHYYKIRNLDYRHYLNIAKFKDSRLRYLYPCYPLIDYTEKNNNNNLTVSIIGGGNYENIKPINRLFSKNTIDLNIFRRKIWDNNNILLQDIDKKFNINYIEDITTNDMIRYLKNSSYVMINYNNDDHNNAISSSGSIPLALSTLCKPIIVKSANIYFQIKNVIEFDIDLDSVINLDNDNLDFKAIQAERNSYIDKFQNYIENDKTDKTDITDKNTALIIEPRDLDNLENIILDFHKKLGNEWNFVFYCGKGLKPKYTDIFLNNNNNNNNNNNIDNNRDRDNRDIDITIYELETNNFSPQDYNNFMKTKKLYENLTCNYILVFQQDTFIINKSPYSINDFIGLNLSYIGGNMRYNWNELQFNNYNFNYRNFNGGLSLRKRTDMIKIIETLQPLDSVGDIDIFETYAEDAYFTIGCLKLNLNIGNTEFCSHFAVHTIMKDKFFGVHKPIADIRDKLLDISPEISKNQYI